MYKLLIKIVIFLILAAPVIGMANPLGSQFPSALLYQGKPIDPLCLSDASDLSKPINLAKCGLATEKGYKFTNYNQDLIKQGFFGFDYEYRLDNATGTYHGYSYYKSYGMANGADIIYLINNSGGSGQFSALYSVKRNGNLLQVKSYDGGDRCNGGITDVKRDNNQLTYHQNLTSYDLFALANDNPHKLSAYSDLEACAACCVATVVLKHDLKNDTSEQQFVSVDLTSYPIDPKNPPQQGKYQACFNNFLLQAEANKKSLSPNDLAQLVKKFNLECLK